MSDVTLFQINAAMGILLTVSLTALFVLMAILWPRTRLNKLALWFMFWMCAVMWRWVAGVLRPGDFGARESLIASVIFGVASVSTMVFASVAWWEHVRDARHPPS